MDTRVARGHDGGRRRRRGHDRRRAMGAALAVAAVVAVTACTSSATTGSSTGSSAPNGTGGARGVGAPATPNLQLASALAPFGACDQLLDFVKGAALERVGPYGLPTSARPGGLAESGAPAGTEPAAGPATTDAPAAGETPGAAPQTKDGTSTDSAAGSETPTATGPDAASHSETNVQEQGVDEPDTVKTDGKRILALANGRLVAVDVTGAAPRNAGSLALPGTSTTAQLLLSGDHVLVIDGDAPDPEATTSRAVRGTPTSTLLTLVDIADAAQMKILTNVRIDGRFVSARMVDGHVRVVTSSTPSQLPFVNPSSTSALAQQAAENANRRIVEESKIEDWLPQAHVGNGTNPTTRPLLDCTKVSHPKTFSGFGVLAVVSIDVNGSEINPADSVGVMADGQTVYASKSNLYVTTPAYADVPRNPSRVPGTGTVPTTRVPTAVPLRDSTAIHKFSIEAQGPAVYRASGEVEGAVLNQYSLSEDGGALRVATTTSPAGSRGCLRCPGTESFVRVLQEVDGELQQVGQVGNLGRGEQIKAVRFVGKQGYVVTFRQTDPLYTLDLADPTAPKVVGELKILGYSAYLHPAGDNLLIGIGQDATANGRSLGTKVSLFDVADLANPRELQKYVLWNSTSEVEQDFHAFLYWEPAKLAMIPITRASVGVVGGCRTDIPNAGVCAPHPTTPAFTGALGLTVDRNGIVERGRVVNPASPSPYPGCREIEDHGSPGGTTGVRDGGCESPCPPDAMCSGVVSAPATTAPAPCAPDADCQTKPVTPAAPVPAGAPIERSLVVGDTVFTFSTNGIKSSALDDLHEKYWLPFT